MKIEGTQELRAPRERVWQALVDPAVLQRCIPGCERLEKTGENSYAATLRAGVGAIKGVFNGNVRLEDMSAPSHYRIVVDGRGQPGFLKGAGDLDLEEKDGATAVRYAGSAVACVMNHTQPAANTKPPTAPNAAGWRPSARRPEVNAVVAASSGPGANPQNPHAHP